MIARYSALYKWHFLAILVCKMPRNSIEILTYNVFTRELEFIPLIFKPAVVVREQIQLPNIIKRRKIDPVKKAYYKKVWEITLANDIVTLMGDKKRGQKDYHIDHKIPISYGFKNNISAEQIGHISNLQPLFWKDNFLKSAKYEKVN